MRLGGKVSQPFQTSRGVRQGCLLSPLLFNLTLDRALANVMPRLSGIRFGDEHGEFEVKCRAYADDVVLLAGSVAAMQQNLDALREEFERFGLTISTTKTQFMTQDFQHRPQRMNAGMEPSVAGIQTLPDGNQFFKVEKGAKLLACPTCGTQLKGGPRSLRRHFQAIHSIAVLVGTEEPRLIEPAPPAEILPSGRFRCPVTGCGKTYCRALAAADHWRKRVCHSTPPAGPKAVTGTTLQQKYATRDAFFAHRTTDLDTPLLVNGTCIKRVKKFTYLGRTFSDEDDDSWCIRERIDKARGVFNGIHDRLLKGKTSRETCLAVYRAVIRSQVLFASGTWVSREEDIERLRSAQQKCLRHCLRMHPTLVDGIPMYPKRETVLKAAEEPDIGSQVHHSQLRLLGHILRLPEDDQSRRLLTATIRGAPPREGFTNGLLWRERVRGLLPAIGMTIDDAIDRGNWRLGIGKTLVIGGVPYGT